MRSILISLTLVALATSLAEAQTQTTNQPPKATNVAPQVFYRGASGAWDCPVEMSAQPRGASGSEWIIALGEAEQTKSGDAARSRDAGVHVEVNAPKDKSLSRVKLAVEYKKRPSGFQPADGSQETADGSKSYELSAGDGAARLLAGDLLVGPDLMATQVHVISLTYSDGSTYTVEKRACTAPVNFMVRIGTH